VIVGVSAIPTAPLLVPGVSATLPHGVPAVVRAVTAALRSVPPADVMVLITAGESTIDDGGIASLAGIGRPDLEQRVAGSKSVADALIGALVYPGYRGRCLPLGAAVLTFLWRQVALTAPVEPRPGVVSVSVPSSATFEVLTDVGADIVAAAAGSRLAVVVAGDLSAGLTEASPLFRVDGAQAWDDRAVAVVDSGRLRGLARLGPEEARRVGALGWAPLAVAHGVCSAAKIGMVLRSYLAPRGVGYLVACGA
jgi:hypothetical protein